VAAAVPVGVSEDEERERGVDHDSGQEGPGAAERRGSQDQLAASPAAKSKALLGEECRRFSHDDPPLLRINPLDILDAQQEQAAAEATRSNSKRLRLILTLPVSDPIHPADPPAGRLDDEAFASAKPILPPIARPPVIERPPVQA
jgi:hypothetical protein